MRTASDGAHAGGEACAPERPASRAGVKVSFVDEVDVSPGGTVEDVQDKKSDKGLLYIKDDSKGKRKNGKAGLMRERPKVIPGSQGPLYYMDGSSGGYDSIKSASNNIIGRGRMFKYSEELVQNFSSKVQRDSNPGHNPLADASLETSHGASSTGFERTASSSGADASVDGRPPFRHHIRPPRHMVPPSRQPVLPKAGSRRAKRSVSSNGLHHHHPPPPPPRLHTGGSEVGAWQGVVDSPAASPMPGSPALVVPLAMSRPSTAPLEHSANAKDGNKDGSSPSGGLLLGSPGGAAWVYEMMMPSRPESVLRAKEDRRGQQVVRSKSIAGRLSRPGTGKRAGLMTRSRPGTGMSQASVGSQGSSQGMFVSDGDAEVMVFGDRSAS
jgi:hypothetical protein